MVKKRYKKEEHSKTNLFLFKETKWRNMPAISEYFEFVNEVIPGHEYIFVVRPVHGSMRGPESTLTIDIRQFV